jgi:hypothetical protein
VVCRSPGDQAATAAAAAAAAAAAVSMSAPHLRVQGIVTGGADFERSLCSRIDLFSIVMGIIVSVFVASVRPYAARRPAQLTLVPRQMSCGIFVAVGVIPLPLWSGLLLFFAPCIVRTFSCTA